MNMTNIHNNNGGNNAKTTKFADDLKKGLIGEQIFEEDFLWHNRLHYKNVSNDKDYQKVDVDFLTTIGNEETPIEVKASLLPGLDCVVIEHNTNSDILLGPITNGWFEKSKAKVFVFVNNSSRKMVFLKNTNAFKSHYAAIESKYQLYQNKATTFSDGAQVRGAFKFIPIAAIKDFCFSYSKKDGLRPIQ